MNLPNKLTILRVILIPFFVVFMLFDITGAADKWIALVIFCVASLTDMLDGKIARKYNLVTNFGKFMDPLADKLLVCTALICLTSMNRLNVIVVLVIIAREFIISGFRLVASDNGIVIAASYWGQIQNRITDGTDHCADHGSGRCVECCRYSPYMGSTAPDRRFTDRLYCKEQTGINTGRHVKWL